MTSSSSRLTEEQYRLLVEHGPTMLWRSSLDGRCDYFNTTWLAYTGRELDQEVGEGWLASIHPDDLGRCLQTRRTSFDQRQPFELEFRLRRRDGMYRWVLDRGVPLYDDKTGMFAGFVGSAVDVHNRVRADADKSSFLEMMAHELRTPLTPMWGYAQQLKNRLQQGEPITRDLAEKLARQVERFTILVTGLAEASRIDRGDGINVALEPVELSEVVRDVVATHKELLAKRISSSRTPTLLFEHDGRPVRVQGDRARLAQVLANQLDNAAKYSPRGGTIRVSVSAGAEAVVVIADEGIGIPAADLPRLMQPYARGSNASPKNYPGLGLGLAISREIVTAHGGRFSIESRLGQGTKVTMALPRLEGGVS